MGKYIIEVGDAHVRHALGRKLIIPVIINNNTEYWVNTNIQLTPYTEPDMEKVREEAYEDGYKTAKVQCNIQAEKDMREVGERHYQKGLSDAWEAARKILRYGKTGGKLEVLTGVFSHAGGWWDIINKYTASEAIEKIRQYEQKQGEIQVGDEVTDDKGDTGVCTEISYPANSMHIMYADGTATDISLTGVTQTGRHFPEIAEVLAKMKE